MRLTADLILSSLSYINPIQERELDLRGNKIPAIENLGVAPRDQDCIDFTDNDITVLANFPLSPRIQTLLLTRNRVAAIQPTLAKSIPNLKALVLAHNRIAELADLEPLAKFSKLTYLILHDNPVTKKANYRSWVLWRCRNVRFLDYQKVKLAEREKADELFGTREAPTELATQILSVISKNAANTARTNGADTDGVRIKLTAKERKRVEEMVKNAKSLKEIDELQKMLDEGRVPGGIIEDEEMT